MARIHSVKRSNKDHICGRGGHTIPKGEPYTWAKPGFRRRTPLIRCAAHPFRQSELMTGLASEPTAAVEAFEDAAAAGFDSIEDLESAWDELRSTVEDYVNQRQEALDAWEHGNSQLEEYVYTAQAALDEVEGFTPESFDEPDEDGWDEDDWSGGPDDFDGYVAHKLQEHVEEQTEAALEIAGGLEF